MAIKTIKVDYLARVEGEGALYLKIHDDELQDVQLKIFEPPRFFEAFMRERKYTEAPDITARICGICPVAYQMSSVHAMEQIMGVTVGGPLRDLRRLLYCGEWIESHGLHVYMLHAPDFLGYPDAITLAKDAPDHVKRGLALKKVGNDIVNFMGGREIHPINVRVGGFYRVPTQKEMKEALWDKLHRAREQCFETVKWAATFEYPDFDQDYEFVSIRHPDEYPFNEGRIVSNKGLDIDKSEFYDIFEEQHVERSNALHCVHKERGCYHVGPLARYSLNYDKLTDGCKEAAKLAGLGPICTNPFKSLLVRGVELLYAVEEAIRVINDYTMPDAPFVQHEIRAGVGHGATEAPRGMLYHRYEVDDKGEIVKANIVPPTSQNQKQIEDDLWKFVPTIKDLPQDKLTLRCEQAVRNYDPCISCATHFLKLELDRG